MPKKAKYRRDEARRGRSLVAVGYECRGRKHHRCTVVDCRCTCHAVGDAPTGGRV